MGRRKECEASRRVRLVSSAAGESFLRAAEPPRRPRFGRDPCDDSPVYMTELGRPPTLDAPARHRPDRPRVRGQLRNVVGTVGTSFGIQGLNAATGVLLARTLGPHD